MALAVATKLSLKRQREDFNLEGEEGKPMINFGKKKRDGEVTNSPHTHKAEEASLIKPPVSP
ncbi:DUF748 domain-containing protein [Sesbania bispinosa]|nr:DUF748 domain-containing protein [Sesbania bispinosa]